MENTVKECSVGDIVEYRADDNSLMQWTILRKYNSFRNPHYYEILFTWRVTWNKFIEDVKIEKIYKIIK